MENMFEMPILITYATDMKLTSESTRSGYPKERVIFQDRKNDGIMRCMYLPSKRDTPHP